MHRNGHQLIALTAAAHFGAYLSAFFYSTRFFENNVPFDNTSPIYLISLLCKLGLGLGLDSELHYFSIFHGEQRKRQNEHLIFREFHGRQHQAKRT